VYDVVVKKVTFAISSPDEFLVFFVNSVTQVLKVNFFQSRTNGEGRPVPPPAALSICKYGYEDLISVGISKS